MHSYLDLYYISSMVKCHYYTHFFLKKKKGMLISCQSQSVVRLSVLACVMFLVNVSPPKP